MKKSSKPKHPPVASTRVFFGWAVIRDGKLESVGFQYPPDATLEEYRAGIPKAVTLAFEQAELSIQKNPIEPALSKYGPGRSRLGHYLTPWNKMACPNCASRKLKSDNQPQTGWEEMTNVKCLKCGYGFGAKLGSK